MAETPVQPPHEVRTEHLILRSARAGDGPALRDAIGVSLNEFFPWLSFSAQLSDHETLERIEARCDMRNEPSNRHNYVHRTRRSMATVGRN